MQKDYQERESVGVDAIKKVIPSSLKSNMIPQSKGLFAELYENKEVFPNHYLACAIDGVGTKLILAQAMEKYDTVGIDLVAMSANDLATFGSVSPFLFIDYLACEHKIEEEGLTGDIVKGMVKGLEQCSTEKIYNNSIKINFGKGETASVDELMSGVKPGYGFDIAGGMIGFIPKKKMFEIKPGQKIIGLPSTGLHSNGYTDARLHLLKGDFETRPEFRRGIQALTPLDDPFDGSTIGEILLNPTKIYMREIAQISKEFPLIGVNNTGYGLKNFNRLGNFKFHITNPLPPQPIFNQIQKSSSFTSAQMYERFNMGTGFFIVCEKEGAQDILNKIDGEIVGEIEKSPRGKTVLKDMVFEGY